MRSPAADPAAVNVRPALRSDNTRSPRLQLDRSCGHPLHCICEDQLCAPTTRDHRDCGWIGRAGIRFACSTQSGVNATVKSEHATCGSGYALAPGWPTMLLTGPQASRGAAIYAEARCRSVSQCIPERCFVVKYRTGQSSSKLCSSST